MLQILRTGTNAAAAIGVAYWLSTHSARPIPAPPEHVRRDHRIAANSATPPPDILLFHLCFCMRADGCFACDRGRKYCFYVTYPRIGWRESIVSQQSVCNVVS